MNIDNLITKLKKWEMLRKQGVIERILGATHF